MQNKKRPYLWAIIYGTILVLFTLFVIMDTFVISRTYTIIDNQTAESENEQSQDEGENTEEDDSLPDDNIVLTDSSYSDENIRITITEYREYDSSIYVADIVLSDAQYLKTALANDVYGKNVTEPTSTIAANNNAILAINGDFYGSQTRGFVVRNGVLYRNLEADNEQEDLVIWNDGSFGIVTEGSVLAETLVNNGASQVLSFGPCLLENGTISVSENEEVDKAMNSNPRTAIGIIDDLHYVMIVSDGRTDESTGLTLYQLATFLEGLGVTTAYNLDGGGSATMVFNGEVINNPTSGRDAIKERGVSDIVYIGY